MLSKTILSVLGMTASGILFAGTMGPVCTPGNVTAPCEARHWSLGLQGLYLNAVQGDSRNYRFSPTTTFASIDDQWNWGYKAQGSFEYHQGNDLSVSWLHFSDSEQQVGFVTPFAAGAAVLGVPYALANRTHFDQVNLVAGQEIGFSAQGKARFYGGLQYANINSTALNYYAALPFPVANTGGVFHDTSYFKGVGPVVGIDYSYDAFNNGLTLVANGATSLVYGTSRLSEGYVLAPTNLVLGSVFASRSTVVPGFDAKLGLNYAYNMPQGMLNVEGGYQATYYLDVLQGQSLQVLTSAVNPANFGVYGPYVGFKFVGMA